MFTALNALAPGAVPAEVRTKKALVIINCQNDAFYQMDDFIVTKNPDYVDALRDLIPHFRRVGNVIWVRTEMGSLPAKPSPDSEKVEHASHKAAEENKEIQARSEAGMQQGPKETSSAGPPGSAKDAGLQTYEPSSRIKRIMTHAPAAAKAEKRSNNLQALDGDEEGDRMEERLVKPRKGQQSQFFVAGTAGAEIADRLKDLVQDEDLFITKHFYSAFDQTDLLTSLRMGVVTEVYLCGGLTNASVYSTAADAVQHGLGVSVVEDCLGWRSRDKHEEALHQMRDIMGVVQTTSEEIIEESGGRVLPDSDTPGITLRELEIGQQEKEGQAALLKEGTPRPATNQADIPLPSVETSRDDKSDGERNKHALLGPSDRIAEGDSRIHYSLLEQPLADEAFERLSKEVQWLSMSHRGGAVPRLVSVQGEVRKDGEIPLYRHPADESPPLRPFSPTVSKIRQRLESILQQPFNHVLIQLYRTGEDNISEHADKSLDIVQGSSIVNVSLGAQRMMTLRTKKGQTSPEAAGARSTQRVPLPHNSVFVLGPQSNKVWLHGVRADKRPPVEKTEDEKAFEGERISLTFRNIGTFMDKEQQLIWGSGARNKTRAQAARVSDDAKQMETMIMAFGRENHSSDLSWDEVYSTGFDVVNLRTVDPSSTTTAPTTTATSNKPAQLSLSSDPVANLRVQLCLQEANVKYTIIDRKHSSSNEPSTSNSTGDTPSKNPSLSEKPWIHGLSNTERPVLTGLEGEGSVIEGDLAILIALERRLRPPDTTHSYTPSQLYRCIAQSNELLYLWYELQNAVALAEEEAAGEGGGGGAHAPAPPLASSPPATSNAKGSANAAISAPIAKSPSPSNTRPTSSSNRPTRPQPPRRTTSSPTNRFRHENKTNHLFPPPPPSHPSPTPEAIMRAELHSVLRSWEDYLRDENAGMEFIAGDFFSVLDAAFWPVFRDAIEGGNATTGQDAKAIGADQGKGKGLDGVGIRGVGGGGEEELKTLMAYHRRVQARESVREVLGY